MEQVKRLTMAAAVVGAVLSMAACGGDSPFAATSVNGSSVVLKGTVLNLVPSLGAGLTTPAGVVGVAGAPGAATSAKGPVAAASADETINVYVLENPDIKTTVDEDGGFVLRGLPAGSFTLVFTDGAGAELGRLTFDAVLPNQELTVSVEVTDGRVVLVEEQRNGIGHAGLEIQGSIDAISKLDPSGDSVFVIAGYEVLARPGATAIRRDNVGLTVSDLSVGDQVHVKGAWLPLESGTTAADQQVLAHEIKLQDGDDSDGPKVTICHKGKQTLSIGASAWPAHMAHGDTLGACK